MHDNKYLSRSSFLCVQNLISKDKTNTRGPRDVPREVARDVPREVPREVPITYDARYQGRKREAQNIPRDSTLMKLNSWAIFARCCWGKKFFSSEFNSDFFRLVCYLLFTFTATHYIDSILTQNIMQYWGIMLTVELQKPTVPRHCYWDRPMWFY